MSDFSAERLLENPARPTCIGYCSPPLHTHICDSAQAQALTEAIEKILPGHPGVQPQDLG